MGHGIAVVFARAGHGVTVFDPQETSLETLPQRAAASLSAMGVSADDQTDALALIRTATSLEACVADAEIVTEAAPENLDLKQTIFAELEAAAPRNCILASNTSVIPITQIVQHLETVKS